MKINENLINKITNSVLSKLNEEEKIYSTPNLKLAELISNAIKSEADAIRIYLNLLQYTSDEDDVADIQEIIQDEENHKVKLEKIMRKYNKIPPAKD
jgi:rubrerythrin